MYDLIIKNGTIVDGSGADALAGDIAIKNGVIMEISSHINAESMQVVDATGQVVAPGFIDIHRHSDAFVFRDGFGEIQLRQGITTTINGNCGLSIVPCPAKQRKEILQYLRPIVGSLPEGIEFDTFSEYLSAVENIRLPINFGMHIGNGTLRMATRGFEKGELQEEDYVCIHKYLRDAIDSGAFGVSLGLVYMPENMYDLDSITRALDPIRNSNIPIVAHIRGEGDLLIKSLEEVLAIARQLNIPLHVSHFKCVGKRNWKHLLREALNLLDKAREGGMRVTCDVYPWTAGSTQLVQLLPPEYLEGGMKQTVQRLTNPYSRARCVEILKTPQSRFENLLHLVGWENIMITTVQTPENQKYIGMRVSEIAQAKGIDPYECAFDLLIEENCNISMVNFIACEDDIETILRYPYSCIISDSIYPDGGMPHPRQFGTFPKILAEYVRERQILTLEQAIHKFTGAPAMNLSIHGKGLLQKGLDADVTIFNPDTVQNNADYISPTSMAAGFSYVFVNGVLANDHDRFISNDAGKVLRRG